MHARVSGAASASGSTKQISFTLFHAEGGKTKLTPGTSVVDVYALERYICQCVAFQLIQYLLEDAPTVAGEL